VTVDECFSRQIALNADTRDHKVTAALYFFYLGVVNFLVTYYVLWQSFLSVFFRTVFPTWR